MTITYGFYNSVGNDRRYNAEQMSSLFDGIINDGVFMSIGNALMVSVSSGMTVIVGLGRAWFNHTWTNNDAAFPLTVEASEVVLNRIDTVVLEVNSSQDTRANTFKIIKGTPSTVPIPPALIASDNVHQHPLCHISVAAGVTSINASNITNKVGTSDCPFVTGILETMDVDALLVQWDSEFNIWLDSIKNALDGDTAGNLYNLINNRIVKGSGTIPKTGWVSNTGDYAYKLNVAITGVVTGNWVDITIDKEYQDVAAAAGICATVDEYDGGITFYATTVPSSDIPMRYKVVN